MLFSTINFLATAVLFGVSLWCVFSHSYDDGIVGKLIFILLGLSCYAALTEYPQQPNEITHTAMTCSVAASALREFVITKISPLVWAKKPQGVRRD